MANTSSLPANWEVNVVFSIFLFNQISANYLCSLGITRRFLAMKSEWGFSKLISKKVMSEPSNGYLIDDTCVLGAEVFIVKKEAAIQRLSLNNCDVPYERDWKITNFSKLGNLWESEEFIVRGHKWKIWLYPKGNKGGVGTYVSMYLFNAGYERVQASYTLCIKNQVSDEHKKLTITNHLFTPSSSSWGWPTFMEIATMNDPKKGFIVNDSCLVHVEISSVEDAAQ
ncbi:PREDICTED: ubiquitin carboxyl-terminal hydrolase 13-like [Erythranthe guttata]|nr:PREDICTED: ubiquitin carboxyl-terminal hydrolase 13-like [Erythranthe guttata]|eukprot:XP_012833029.1 PREDICTED: ubiquitin carboxyl-terminal hydrolase 13-like [Erythranthe guttata]